MEDNNLVKINSDKTNQLVDQLIKEDDPNKTKEMINLFNINIAKKNTLRVIKANEVLDKVNDEVYKRISERPDGITDKDLISYMNAAQLQIDKSLDKINSVGEIPVIQVNQDNSVNINVGESLSKDSRDRVLKVVQELLKNNDDAIDVDIKKK